jgi:hypothetical protein
MTASLLSSPAALASPARQGAAELHGEPAAPHVADQSMYAVASVGASYAAAVGVGGSDWSLQTRRFDGKKWRDTDETGGPLTEMWGVDALSATEAWGVGSDHNTALTERWDGTTWRRVKTPPPDPDTGDDLRSVSIVAMDDVWAVGYTRLADFHVRPLIEHWDGKRWTKIAYQLPFGNTLGSLGGVLALASDDVRAVGSTSGVRSAPLILHWDGSGWTPMLVPTTDSRRISILNAIDAASPDDIWAVGNGDGPVALHWDGHAWSRVPTPPGRGGTDWTNGVTVIAPDDVWAVGGYGDATWMTTTRIMHWDGHEWSRVRSPNPGGSGYFADNSLWSVSGSAPDQVWAVGSYGEDGVGFHPLFLRWDGHKWTRYRHHR